MKYGDLGGSDDALPVKCAASFGPNLQLKAQPGKHQRTAAMLCWSSMM